MRTLQPADAAPPPLPCTDEQPSSFLGAMYFVSLFISLFVYALACVLIKSCRRRRRGATSSPADPQMPATSVSDYLRPPKKGLPKAAIDALPTVSFGKEAAASQPECAICLEEFAEGQGLRVLPLCRHMFHVACVDEWLQESTTCPFCREKVIVVPAVASVAVVVAP